MPSKFTETPCTLEDGFGLVGGVLKRDRNHVRDDTESVSSNDEICFKKHKTKQSPSNKQVLKHGLPNFEMCTELFKNSVATGAYTRSSQSQVPINATPDEDSIPNEDTIPNEDSIPNENTPYDTPSPMSHSVHETAGGSGSSSRKRHSSSADEDRESLKRGFKSFQCYLDRKMSSADICLDVVQKIEGIPTSLVLKDARRFENVEARNVFLGLNDANRVAWVWDLANE
ncbi:hypothetical protein ACS0TY_014071 [Phlomoides rotata]